MTILCESEIDVALLSTSDPEYRPYVQYLSDWRHIINLCSDGWTYWRIGRNASERLQTLVHDLMNWRRYGGDAPHRLPQLKKPTLKNFEASLIPIKNFAIKHKLEVPTLNKNKPETKLAWKLEETFYTDRREPHRPDFIPGPQIKIWSKPGVPVEAAKCICYDPAEFDVKIEFQDRSFVPIIRCRTCLNNLIGRRP